MTEPQLYAEGMPIVDLDTGTGVDQAAGVGLLGATSGGKQIIGATGNALDVNIKSGGGGGTTVAQDKGSSDGGTTWHPIAVDADGKIQIRALTAADVVTIWQAMRNLEAESVLVNAASVNAAASTAVAPFDNHVKLARYLRFRVSCDKAHSVAFYAANATFSALTSAEHLFLWDVTGKAANNANGGDIYDIEVDAAAYVACVVTNNDGAVAATITVAGRAHD